MNKLITCQPQSRKVHAEYVCDIDFFRSKDDLFNQLYKIWLDAQANVGHVLKACGKDSALADIALYHSHSAQAAWQARLIELRSEESKSQSQAVLNSQAHEKSTKEKKLEKVREMRDQKNWEDHVASQIRLERENQSHLFWILLLYVLFRSGPAFVGYDRPYPPPWLRNSPV